MKKIKTFIVLVIIVFVQIVPSIAQELDIRWIEVQGDTFTMRTGSDIKRACCGNSFDNPASDPRRSAVRIEEDARHYNVGFRIVKTK